MRFGAIGSIVTAVAATLLAGPLLPADVSASIPQQTGEWATRGAFFVAVAMFTSILISFAESSWRLRVEVAEKERELTRKKIDILQNVSHELRTPLTVIKATAIILQRRKLVEEQADVLVGSLVDAANKLEEKVMLALEASGRPDRRRALEKVDLARLTNDVAKSLERTEEPRRVLFESGMSTPAVITDPEAMTVILKCIVDNALKFSPPEKPVKVAVKDQDGEVAITVEDQGPGVPEDFAKEAFEPFTQADTSLSRAAGGLGIGLYAAHRLAGSIGARLNLSSSEAGTRLTISIPQRRTVDD